MPSISAQNTNSVRMTPYGSVLAGLTSRCSLGKGLAIPFDPHLVLAQQEQPAPTSPTLTGY